MSSVLPGVPDVGMTRKVDRITNIPAWTVDLSIYSMTSAQARQIAAELLNMADTVDKLNGEP